ncbi:hypothetical protein T4B_3617 [Trichinella pseudospiralis]|uniref:Uncharacterized protein n=1 Tax=Trichinella pseudospiralis TaxID=6337 RepID=A0A0V1JHY6_TRIPS|nr:hypothetical protein T4B_3617 [Trichinella pseudospiralis]
MKKLLNWFTYEKYNETKLLATKLELLNSTTDNSVNNTRGLYEGQINKITPKPNYHYLESQHNIHTRTHNTVITSSTGGRYRNAERSLCAIEVKVEVCYQTNAKKADIIR